MPRLPATLLATASLLLALPAACLAAGPAAVRSAVRPAPAADHHQHLFSPAIIALIAPRPGPDALTDIAAWEAFRAPPLSPAEINRIANNVAPYLR